jgi:glycosyltransferase involved in cell wall biosynthesis
MHLLMLGYEFPPLGGGAGIVNYFLCKEFAKDPSMHIDLVTSSTTSYRQEKFADNITVHYLDIGKDDSQFLCQSNKDLIKYSIKALPYCKKLIASQPYDLVHAVMGVPAGYIATQLGLPFVVSLHGSDVPFHNPRFKTMDRLFFKYSSKWMWKKAAAVVTVSNDLAARARRVAPDQVIQTIYTGVDTDLFKPTAHPLIGQTILFVGRLSVVKAPDLLMDAFIHLAKQHVKARLEFVGDGPLKQMLKEKAKSSGLSERILFHGRCEQSALPAKYARAYVLAVPSRNEALGNIVLEAMACKVPIVTTATGAAELIDANGIVVPKNDVSALTNALDQILSDPGKRQAMAEQSLSLSTHYTWQQVGARFKILYQTIGGSLE